jgi:hypothetical protein
MGPLITTYFCCWNSPTLHYSHFSEGPYQTLSLSISPMTVTISQPKHQGSEGQTAGGPKRWELSKETLLLPRKLLCAPERHLHPQAIKKAIKTQFPTWPTGPPVSGSPCMPPCSLSLLFSTNQIFPTSAAGVCPCCFHSQSGPKNSEHLRISACHLCISRVCQDSLCCDYSLFSGP